MNDRALRWNHPSLDEICRRLDGFGAGLFVFDSQQDLAHVWKLSSTGLLNNARAAGLKPLQEDCDASRTGPLMDRVRRDALDLLVLKNEQRDPSALQEFFRNIATVPSALIIFTRVLPPGWESVFDVAVEFSAGQARIRRKNNPTSTETHECSLAVTPLPTASVSTTAVRIATLGLTAHERSYLARQFELETVSDLASPESQEAAVPADLLIIRGSPKDHKILDAIQIQKGSGNPLIALGDGIIRDEDRCKMYAAGARAVLPRKATVEEIAAAASANLSSAKLKEDPVTHWLSEMERLLQSVPRGHKVWSLGDEETVTQTYAPVLSHQLRRAQELEISAGALILRLPQLPAAIISTGWSKVLHKTLLASLTEAIRTHDLSFLVQDWLIVVSHCMDHLAARAITRRIAEQMPESESGRLDWRIIPAHFGPGPDYGGKDLIREIFNSVRNEAKGKKA